MRTYGRIKYGRTRYSASIPVSFSATSGFDIHGAVTVKSRYKAVGLGSFEFNGSAATAIVVPMPVDHEGIYNPARIEFSGTYTGKLRFKGVFPGQIEFSGSTAPKTRVPLTALGRIELNGAVAAGKLSRIGPFTGAIELSGGWFLSYKWSGRYPSTTPWDPIPGAPATWPPVPMPGSPWVQLDRQTSQWDTSGVDASDWQTVD